MRILFMGTPDIAAAMLQKISAAHTICGVFCQPDKPVGRKAVLTPPPVKVMAQQLGVPVYQPVKMRDGTAADTVRSLAPELVVVVAYGRILPKEILEIPPYGCINIHVSLLPQYRGAAPIQHALLNDERKTGVTAMYMAEGLDTGDVIAVREMEISDADDAATLFARSAGLGGDLLLEVIAAVGNGTASRSAQHSAVASAAPPLTKEMGAFSFEEDARAIFNKVRALCIWPVAYFERGGRKIKVQKAAHTDQIGVPGEILALNPLTVAARNGAVQLLEVKPEGGRLMQGREYAMGQRLFVGGTIIL
jgi:methionyl-tRNA formyltransferase